MSRPFPFILIHLTSLFQFQEAVKTRFGGDQDVDLAGPLIEVAGALELIGERDTARLTVRLKENTFSLIKHAVSETAIPARRLELFTDAVAALELYLAASRDQQENRGRFLDILQKRLDVLEGGEDLAAREAVEEYAEPAAPVPEPETEVAAHDPHVSQPAEPVVLDQELLDVFLEEYDVVSETLQNYLPQWLARLDDVSSLTEVRRSFHTLKGSGRMVGAFELGDFAWQIEELLNALLDTRISTFADAAVTVRLAQAALPALKQRLMQQPAGLRPEAIAAIGRHAECLTRNAGCDWH